MKQLWQKLKLFYLIAKTRRQLQRDHPDAKVTVKLNGKEL